MSYYIFDILSRTLVLLFVHCFILMLLVGSIKCRRISIANYVIQLQSGVLARKRNKNNKNPGILNSK